MGEGMSKAARDELLEAVRARYRDANRSEKSRILDEFAAISGYHRKHAIRVLLRDVTPEMRKGTQARIYDEAVRDALVVLWEASDRICGKRLKAALPGLLSRMETHGHLALDRSVREKLMRMSAATIDRCLVPARQGIKGKRRRAKNSAIKRQIPVRTSADWKDAAPGYLEADFVVHSGGSMKGSPVHSFVLTDVCSGWTEAVPLIVREQTLVVEALRVLQQQLPVPLLGIIPRR